MLGELLEIGDLVSIRIAEENRSWGYNPCPDGTLATVEGFGEIDYGYTNNFGYQPGIYQNRCWANVKLPSGEVIHISTCFLETSDPSEVYQKKLEAHRQILRTGEWRNDKLRLRDLPETKLWVGDYVSPPARYREYQEMRVVGVNYRYIDQKRSNGSPMPIYDISDKYPSGWHTSAGDQDLTLLRRGNVWNYYHQKPMTFASLEEEAQLFLAMGRTRDVRNPSNGLYKWTKEEVLDAIENGIAHSLSLHNGFFGGAPFENAIWFLDEELGKRVAERTLQGFGRK